MYSVCSPTVIYISIASTIDAKIDAAAEDILDLLCA